MEYQRLTGTVAENVGYEQWFGIIGDGTRIGNKSLEQDTSKSECQIKTGDQTESEVMECQIETGTQPGDAAETDLRLGNGKETPDTSLDGVMRINSR